MRDNGARDRQAATPAILPGKVLLAGVGFMVTGAAWALLAFFQSVDGQQSLVWLDTALLVAHLAAGIAVLMRLRFAWPIGILVALAGIAASFANNYYFIVVPDAITLLLLLLSHAEMQRRPQPRRQG